MAVRTISIKTMIPVVILTWVLSLISTLAIVYFAPSIFPVTITSDKIANEAVVTYKLADGSVNSAKIMDGSITAMDIADGAIITFKIADAAVTTEKIEDGAVTSGKIAEGTIMAVDLVDGAIVTAKIKDEAVTSDKIANNNVTTAEILNGTILAADLADGQITGIKIADGTITTVNIADGAVTTTKIADGNVTTAKIADGAVTNVKLSANAIPFTYVYKAEATADSTASTTWTLMPGMSVDITLERKSHLLIMFSTEAANPDPTQFIAVRALVGENDALPGSVYLTPYDTVDYASYTYNFYLPNVDAGTYTVKIEWKVSGSTGYVWYRNLIVLALPA